MNHKAHHDIQSNKHYKRNLKQPLVYFLVGQLNISQEDHHKKRHHMTSNKITRKGIVFKHIVEFICFQKSSLTIWMYFKHHVIHGFKINYIPRDKYLKFINKHNLNSNNFNYDSRFTLVKNLSNNKDLSIINIIYRLELHL